ncbi:methyl-accepting chemotaxis protein [Maricurvus nonylphenolicus]|uniref:methyl-accepting chemotaxis protein n=1 Tax=Maricurvus nonylphenolicus TaxID=1008307 RepID=UPI0036F36B79
MFQKVMRSIQLRLTMMVGGVLIISMLTLMIVYTLAVQGMVGDRLLNRELPVVVSELRNAIQAQLKEPIVTSRAMATNSYLLNWARNGEPETGKDAMLQYLRENKKAANASVAFWVSDISGNYFNQDGLLRVMDRNNTRDAWFYGFLQESGDYELSLDTDASTNIPTVFVNHKVKLGNRVVAIAGIGQSLTAMRDIITQYQLGKEGQVYLVNNEGRIQVHKTYGNDSNLALITGQENINASLLDDKDFKVTEFSRDGETIIIAALPVPGTGWYVIAEQPSKELYEALYQTTYFSAFMGLILLAIFLYFTYYICGKVASPIRRITISLEEIASQGGDLTRKVREDREDELGRLAIAFNQFVESLREIITGVRDSATQVTQLSNDVEANCAQTVEHSNQQQEKTDLVASASHEMGMTIDEIAANASKAAAISADAKDAAAEGGNIAITAVDTIKQLSNEIEHAGEVVLQLADNVNDIGSVLEVIRGISEQTNLLALNAAIEAARAGEQGRGFAVVADEVRTLAKRTSESTEEIQQMIEKLQQGATRAVEGMKAGNEASGSGLEAVENVGECLKNIVERIEHISDMNFQIASATEEQSTVTEDINNNVHLIADGGRESAKLSEENSAVAATMSQNASQLQHLVSQFKVE